MKDIVIDGSRCVMNLVSLSETATTTITTRNKMGEMVKKIFSEIVSVLHFIQIECLVLLLVCV